MQGGVGNRATGAEHGNAQATEADREYSSRRRSLLTGALMRAEGTTLVQGGAGNVRSTGNNHTYANIIQ